MRHLNYHHLLYFWTVARRGGITRAASELHLTPQTISGQLKNLADDVGHELFKRVGRQLELTPVGRIVLRYADTIFATGAELAERVRSGDILTSSRLRVGVVNSLAKLIVARVLAAAGSTLRLSCHEGDLDDLLGELALHRLDVVLSDRPKSTDVNIKAYSHRLGSSSIAWFGHGDSVGSLKQGFPESLSGQPLLLPLSEHPLRRVIDRWFDDQGWTLNVRAEFDDSALMKAFARTAPGVFPAPAAIAREAASAYDVDLLGVSDNISESYYALTSERQIIHPGLKEMLAAVDLD